MSWRQIDIYSSNSLHDFVEYYQGILNSGLYDFLPLFEQDVIMILHEEELVDFNMSDPKDARRRVDRYDDKIEERRIEDERKQEIKDVLDEAIYRDEGFKDSFKRGFKYGYRPQKMGKSGKIAPPRSIRSMFD